MVKSYKRQQPLKWVKLCELCIDLALERPKTTHLTLDNMLCMFHCLAFDTDLHSRKEKGPED